MEKIFGGRKVRFSSTHFFLNTFVVEATKLLLVQRFKFFPDFLSFVIFSGLPSHFRKKFVEQELTRA